MFFYYSVYDGAADKTKVKCQFEQMLDKIAEEMKQSYKSQTLKTQSR